MLLEFWSAGMLRNAEVDAYDVLSLLHNAGYMLHDTRVISTPIANDGVYGKVLPSATTFPRPVGFRAAVDWYNSTSFEYDNKFGYWTDIVAVASGDIDLQMY